MNRKSPQSANKNSLMIINSASNHSNTERQSEDFYATPPRMVNEMLEKLKLDLKDSVVWECANGLGHVSDTLEKYEPTVTVLRTDIIGRTPNTEVYDFLDLDLKKQNYPECLKPYIDPETGKFNGHIITNPPYFKGTEFLEKACACLSDGCLCAFFVKIQYLETLKRYKVFQKYPPYKVLISVQRVHCGKDGEFNNEDASGGAACYIWYIYKAGFKGDCTLDWINTGSSTEKHVTSNQLF